MAMALDPALRAGETVFNTAGVGGGEDGRGPGRHLLRQQSYFGFRFQVSEEQGLHQLYAGMPRRPGAAHACMAEHARTGASCPMRASSSACTRPTTMRCRAAHVPPSHSEHCPRPVTTAWTMHVPAARTKRFFSTHNFPCAMPPPPPPHSNGQSGQASAAELTWPIPQVPSHLSHEHRHMSLPGMLLANMPDGSGEGGSEMGHPPHVRPDEVKLFIGIQVRVMGVCGGGCKEVRGWRGQQGRRVDVGCGKRAGVGWRGEWELMPGVQERLPWQACAKRGCGCALQL